MPGARKAPKIPNARAMLGCVAATVAACGRDDCKFRVGVRFSVILPSDGGSPSQCPGSKKLKILTGAAQDHAATFRSTSPKHPEAAETP